MSFMLSVGESSTKTHSSVLTPKDNMSNSFSPSGLHVLVVDDDPLCLMVLERMLKQCSYKVTTCTRVRPALQILRERKDDFDLVMSDVYMPDDDGFKLLEIVGLEMDLPVIMMSGNGETNVVMEGISHGACDYLIKPIRMEELRNIWQHVIRRKRKDALKTDLHDQSSKKRKELLQFEDNSIDHVNNMKKARVNWSVKLHKEFVDAVNQLGVDKAVPKRILEIMKVPGLTRENVASHLQKYRLYLKRLSGIEPEPCPVASFNASRDGAMGGKMMVQTGVKGLTSNSGVKGLNLGAGIPSKSSKTKELDSGTIQSLVQFTLHQQKQAANRKQVLGSLGLSDAQSLGIGIPEGGLQRMASCDLSHFLQSEHFGSSLHQRPLDDLAFRSVKPYFAPDMAMPYISPTSESQASMGITTYHNYNDDTRIKSETKMPLVISPGNFESDETTSQPYVIPHKQHISSDVPYKTEYPAPVVEIDYDMISSSMRNYQSRDSMASVEHLMENTYLDVSDYIPLDEPFA